MSHLAFYDADLAAAHDADFTAYARAAAFDLLHLLAEAGHTRGTVVDLGCGSGVTTAVLAEAGYDVLGVDASPAMIDIARRRAPTARVERASIWEIELPGAVAVTAVGEVVNYRDVADPHRDSEALRRLVRDVRRALVPGGILLFDVATPGRAGPTGRASAFHDRPTYSLYFEAQEATDDGAATLERRMVLFQRDGDRYRRSDEVHHLTLYDAEQVAALLREEGFGVTMVEAYGNLPPTPGWRAFIARRP